MLRIAPQDEVRDIEHPHEDGAAAYERGARYSAAFTPGLFGCAVHGKGGRS